MYATSVGAGANLREVDPDKEKSPRRSFGTQDVVIGIV
jgi:hypothetical protein